MRQRMVLWGTEEEAGCWRMEVAVVTIEVGGDQVGVAGGSRWGEERDVRGGS
jgi:hypothetical protein